MSNTLAEVEAYIREHKPGTVVGVDEAGRGTWAGPIIAAAAAVPADWKGPPERADSKKMSQRRREAVFERYNGDDNVIIGIGMVIASEIDEIGIDPAQAKAQWKALRSVLHRLTDPAFVVVDGINSPAIEATDAHRIKRLMLLPKGDDLVAAVSLASVFAKVTQVRLMGDFDKRHPGYGFAESCGYGTKVHREALARLGPCSIHRRSYRPVSKVLEAIQAQCVQDLLDDVGD